MQDHSAPRPESRREPAVATELRSCRLCADRFAATATAHAPRPVVWFGTGARVLLASQAPGMRVHHSGRPFTDASGERLRLWMGVDEATFYDRSRIAIEVPGEAAPKTKLPRL